MAAKKISDQSGPRGSWKGQLQFGLVVFPVRAINAHDKSQSPIAFHQLHAKCHSRIKYEKHCPIHGQVPNDEIVSGYEFAKGKYIEIEPDELDRLRTSADRSLTIEAFVEPSAIDPVLPPLKLEWRPGGVSDNPTGALRHVQSTSSLLRGTEGPGRSSASGRQGAGFQTG